MTKSIVVSDSSTLILLVKVELIDAIVKQFRVFIPKFVFDESVIKGKEKSRWDSFKIENLVNENLIKIKEPSLENLEKIAEKFNLHAGELHSLALALDLKAEFLLTDDLKAINACKILKIRFVTAVSLLQSFYEKNKTTKKAVAESLTKLEQFGWYSPKIINELKTKLEATK